MVVIDLPDAMWFCFFSSSVSRLLSLSSTTLLSAGGGDDMVVYDVCVGVCWGGVGGGWIGRPTRSSLALSLRNQLPAQPFFSFYYYPLREGAAVFVGLSRCIGYAPGDRESRVNPGEGVGEERGGRGRLEMVVFARVEEPPDSAWVVVDGLQGWHSQLGTSEPAPRNTNSPRRSPAAV